MPLLAKSDRDSKMSYTLLEVFIFVCFLFLRGKQVEIPKLTSEPMYKISLCNSYSRVRDLHSL